MAMQWQNLNIPLAAGLFQKGDARAGDPPSLDICTDAQFDEIGGVQTRPPFVAMANSIWDNASGAVSGSLADTRKIVECNGELLCFTKDALYSWDAHRSAWLRKGTHLAVKVDEEPRFITTSEQITCDRAELGGVVFYCWADVVTTGSGSVVNLAAIDKATGGAIVSPITIVSSDRPRLLALATCVLFFYRDNTSRLVVRKLTPLDPSHPSLEFSVEPLTPTPIGVSQGEYDVCADVANDVAYCVNRELNAGAPVYRLARITSALTGASFIEYQCDGACRVAVTPDGSKVLVNRYASDNPGVPFGPAKILGDIFTASTLANISNGLVIATFALGASEGMPVPQITSVFKPSTFGGQYRNWVFWDVGETLHPTSPTDPSGVYFAVWDTANTIITTARLFLLELGIGSHAFTHDGSVYINLTFSGEQSVSNVTNTGAGSPVIHAQLQNTYFLYQLSELDPLVTGGQQFLVAKSVFQTGGGYSRARGHLPGVSTTGTNAYAWCATERRKIPLEGGLASYADRGPREVVYTFDSDEARRCVRVGDSLLIACGEGLLQYDGSTITECGFHVYPYYFAELSEEAVGSADHLVPGTYSYKATYRSDNARGERDRSTTATILQQVVTIASARVHFRNIVCLHVTHKTRVAIELWRTVTAPPNDAPFYLVTDSDPGDLFVTNAFIVNDPTVQSVTDRFDALPDAKLSIREPNPDNGVILEGIAPPPATIIVANDSRVFLAGISNDPNRVWYSKTVNASEAPGFNEALSFTVPTTGGKITGLAFQSETLVVFCETSIFMMQGDGFANDGVSGANYGPPRCVAADVGAVNQESIALIAQGILFKSRKGWYVVDRSWNAGYQGAAVSNFDSETPLSTHVLSSKHQVRIMSTQRMLVWDYLVSQWSTWTITGGIAGSLYNGVYHYLSSTGPLVEQTSYATANYGMDLETPWVKLGDGLTGMARVRRIQALGEFKSAHYLRIRIARDYKCTAPELPNYFDDHQWTPTPQIVGGPEQVRVGPSQQQCQSIKIRITVTGLMHPGAFASRIFISGGSFTYGGIVTSKIEGAIGNTFTILFDGTGTGTGTFVDGPNAVFYFEPGVTTFDDLINASRSSAYLTLDGFGVINANRGPIDLLGGVDRYYDPPSGESLKLTGLALEVGQKPGTYKMLPAAQKT